MPAAYSHLRFRQRRRPHTYLHAKLVGRRLLLATICEEDKDKYLTLENISEEENKIGLLT